MKTKGLYIKEMDDLLISILAIKNIEEIQFSDLVITPSSSTQFIILPSLYVKYDGKKTLNLCSTDKYFDVFVKKVFEVYMEEKDRDEVVPDVGVVFKGSKLEIDDKTKKVLESGDLTKVSELVKFYDGKKSYDERLMFQIDEVKMMIPIMKHHLKELFSHTNITINFDDNNIAGYKNNYQINCKIDGIDETLIIGYEQSRDNEYYFNIRSLNNIFNPLIMRIQFKEDSMSVDITSKDYPISSSDIYQFEEDKLHHTKRIRLDNKEVYYDSKDLDTVENPYENLTSLDGDTKMKWFKLPWKGLYGVDRSIQDIDDNEHIYSTRTKYLGIIDDNFMIKEIGSVKYHRDRTFETSPNEFVMEEIKKTMYGYRLNPNSDIYIIETGFSDDVHQNGYYDNYLGGKYYYHGIECKDLLSINRDNLIGISKDNNIIVGADLLEEDEVKKLIRSDLNGNI